MTDRFTRWVICIAALLIVLLVVRLSQAPQESLVVAGRADVIAPLERSLDEFNSTRSLAKLGWDVVEGGEEHLHSLDQMCITGNASPDLDSGIRSCDIIMIDQPWVEEFRANPASLTSLKVPDEAKFIPTILEPVRTRCQDGSAGNCYLAAPYVANVQILAYSKEAVEPKTWDAAAFSKPLGGYPLRAGDDSSDVTDDFMPIYWAYDRDIARALGEIKTLSSHEAPSFLSFSDFEASALVLKRGALMGTVWARYAMEMEIEAKDAAAGLKFGQIPGGHPELGVWYLAVPSRAPHRDTAVKFLQFATSKEQLRKAALMGNPPPRSDLLDELVSDKKFQSAQAIREAIRISSARPGCTNWTDVEKEIAKHIRDFHMDIESLPDAASSIGAVLRRCEAEHRLRPNEVK